MIKIFSVLKGYIKAIYFFPFFVLSAQADEPQKYLKFSCIPELKHMELTAIYSNFTFDDDLLNRYGIVHNRKSVCLINGKEYRFEFNKVSNYYIDGKIEKSEDFSKIVDIPYFRISIVQDTNVVVSVEDFGTWADHDNEENEFPQIVTFDGRMIKSCSGVKGVDCKYSKVLKN